MTGLCSCYVPIVKRISVEAGARPLARTNPINFNYIFRVLCSGGGPSRLAGPGAVPNRLLAGHCSPAARPDAHQHMLANRESHLADVTWACNPVAEACDQRSIGPPARQHRGDGEQACAAKGQTQKNGHHRLLFARPVDNPVHKRWALALPS